MNIAHQISYLFVNTSISHAADGTHHVLERGGKHMICSMVRLSYKQYQHLKTSSAVSCLGCLVLALGLHLAPATIPRIMMLNALHRGKTIVNQDTNPSDHQPHWLKRHTCISAVLASHDLSKVVQISQDRPKVFSPEYLWNSQHVKTKRGMCVG